MDSDINTDKNDIQSNQMTDELKLATMLDDIYFSVDLSDPLTVLSVDNTVLF